MSYRIRNAKQEDLAAIESIYDGARAFMARTGNPNQWGKTNPPKWRLEQDIRDGNLYVVTDESGIHGVFAFIFGEDPTYIRIYEGAWSDRRPYGTIHRIASDGSGGIFRACVEYCAGRIDYLRIDTHHNNQVMQHVIEKAGFRRCGIIYIGDGTPRIAYDRA